MACSVVVNRIVWHFKGVVMGRKITPEESFHEKYIKQQNGCWNWVAGADKHGYGRIGIGFPKTEVSSRFSWKLYNGAIPCGLHVCHKCDNPKCVNPDHLFLGTPQDNRLDSKRKQRDSPPPVHFGSTHHKAKIDESIVVKIRELYSTTNLSQRKLSAMFGVSQTVIGRIIRRELWVHVK